MGVLGEWSLRISRGLMQEGKRIEEFGLSSDLGDREAVRWHKLRTNDHLRGFVSHDLIQDCRTLTLQNGLLVTNTSLLSGLILTGIRKQYGRKSW